MKFIKYMEYKKKYLVLLLCFIVLCTYFGYAYINKKTYENDVERFSRFSAYSEEQSNVVKLTYRGIESEVEISKMNASSVGYLTIYNSFKRYNGEMPDMDYIQLKIDDEIEMHVYPNPEYYYSDQQYPPSKDKNIFYVSIIKQGVIKNYKIESFGSFESYCEILYEITQNEKFLSDVTLYNKYDKELPAV